MSQYIKNHTIINEKAITTKVPLEKPTASYSIPESDGPKKDPNENIEVHKLDTNPYVDGESGSPLVLKIYKCHLYFRYFLLCSVCWILHFKNRTVVTWCFEVWKQMTQPKPLLSQCLAMQGPLRLSIHSCEHT